MKKCLQASEGTSTDAFLVYLQTNKLPAAFDGSLQPSALVHAYAYRANKWACCCLLYVSQDNSCSVLCRTRRAVCCLRLLLTTPGFSIDLNFQNIITFELKKSLVLGTQFWDTIYICEVNGAKKAKTNAQVTMNKISDFVHKFFLGVAGGQCPNSNFSKLLECPKRVELGS